MQIWLHKVDFNGTPSQSPLCSVLTRVAHHLIEARFQDDSVRAIQNLALMAARSFPGNLQEYSSNLDPCQFGCEVIRTENERMDFPVMLNRELNAINDHYGEKIEWCLPLIDPELNPLSVVRFVNELKGQNWFTIYVISDVDLKPLFGYTRNVKFVSETEFVATNVVTSFQEKFQTLLPKQFFETPHRSDFEDPQDRPHTSTYFSGCFRSDRWSHLSGDLEDQL